MFCFAIYYVHNRFFRHISADIFVQYAQFNVVEYLKHGNPINRTKKAPREMLRQFKPFLPDTSPWTPDT